MEGPVCRSISDDTRLIETFALTAEGVARLDLHLTRMARSAQELGFAFDAAQVRALLAQNAGPTPQRARLTLAKDGTLDLSTAQMPPAATGWRFAIHPTRLSSEDALLRHKTTQRALYDTARANLPAGVDEWIFLNERGEVCEGTITNVAARIDGSWRTPPVSSSCLPGTYRQSLLDRGEIAEAVLTPDDLRRAEAIMLMNALRGRIAATMISASTPRGTRTARSPRPERRN